MSCCVEYSILSIWADAETEYGCNKDKIIGKLNGLSNDAALISDINTRLQSNLIDIDSFAGGVMKLYCKFFTILYTNKL